MKDRALTQDTKTYNLYQKYKRYKELIVDGRVNKYVIFEYPNKLEEVGYMSDNTFNNIINEGEDKVLSFSIDYGITQNKFQLTNNPVVFEIQDGMFEYLTKDNNIEKLYQLEDEIALYNEAREFILDNTSSSYSKTQKKNKLLSIKIEMLKRREDVGFLNTCIEIIESEHYNTSRLYKAHLLFEKHIINIDTIELAEQIIMYSTLGETEI